MAAESNTRGFNRHAAAGISKFQYGGAISEMIPMMMDNNYNYYYGTGNYSTSIITNNNNNIIFNNRRITTTTTTTTTMQAVNSSSSHLVVDSVPGLKHDAGLAVDWSVEEQRKLKDGLVKFKDEPSIMKYIKIAASFRDKTVRDIALRCRWMMRKRRKQEENNLRKKVKDRKDKLVESSLKTNMSSASPMKAAAYSLVMNHPEQNDSMPCGALSGTTRHLLEQNNQALGQISANLSTLKLQENIDLFFRTRNNLSAILNDMRNMSGIMSQMPPLPEVNEELANSIFRSTTQVPTRRIEVAQFRDVSVNDIEILRQLVY